jgi:hypothetical protein
MRHSQGNRKDEVKLGEEIGMNYVAFTAWGTWALVMGTLAAMAWQTRNSKKLMSTELFLRIEDRYDSGRTREARKSLAQALLQGKGYDEIKEEDVLRFFEVLGSLLRLKLLEEDILWVRFFNPVRIFWSACEDYVRQCRGRLKDETLWEDFEHLYKRLLKIEAKRRGVALSLLELSKDERDEFLEYQAAL